MLNKNIPGNLAAKQKGLFQMSYGFPLNEQVTGTNVVKMEDKEDGVEKEDGVGGRGG